MIGKFHVSYLNFVYIYSSSDVNGAKSSVSQDKTHFLGRDSNLVLKNGSPTSHSISNHSPFLFTHIITYVLTAASVSIANDLTYPYPSYFMRLERPKRYFAQFKGVSS